MTIRTPTTKFFVALTDYLREQVVRDQGLGGFKVEEEKSSANSHWYKIRINTKIQRLNAEQRAHISALAEDLIPATYSVIVEYAPR